MRYSEGLRAECAAAVAKATRSGSRLCSHCALPTPSNRSRPSPAKAPPSPVIRLREAETGPGQIGIEDIPRQGRRGSGVVFPKPLICTHPGNQRQEEDEAPEYCHLPLGLRPEISRPFAKMKEKRRKRLKYARLCAFPPSPSLQRLRDYLYHRSLKDTPWASPNAGKGTNLFLRTY